MCFCPSGFSLRARALTAASTEGSGGDLCSIHHSVLYKCFTPDPYAPPTGDSLLFQNIVFNNKDTDNLGCTYLLLFAW